MMRSLFWPGRMLRGRHAARPEKRIRRPLDSLLNQGKKIVLHFREKIKAENKLLNIQ